MEGKRPGNPCARGVDRTEEYSVTKNGLRINSRARSQINSDRKIKEGVGVWGWGRGMDERGGVG